MTTRVLVIDPNFTNFTVPGNVPCEVRSAVSIEHAANLLLAETFQVLIVNMPVTTEILQYLEHLAGEEVLLVARSSSEDEDTLPSELEPFLTEILSKIGVEDHLH